MPLTSAVTGNASIGGQPETALQPGKDEKQFHPLARPPCARQRQTCFKIL